VVRGQVASDHGWLVVLSRPVRSGGDTPGFEAIRGRKHETALSQHPAIFWHFSGNFRSVRGPLQKISCLPFPVNSLPIPSKFLGGWVNHSCHDFPAKKQETEKWSEIEGGGDRPQETGGNMGSGTVSLCAEHGHTCPFVQCASICCGGYCCTTDSFCRLSNMIQKPKWETSVQHPTVLRSSRVLLLACCHFTWLKMRLQVRTATM